MRALIEPYRFLQRWLLDIDLLVFLASLLLRSIVPFDCLLCGGLNGLSLLLFLLLRGRLERDFESHLLQELCVGEWLALPIDDTHLHLDEEVLVSLGIALDFWSYQSFRIVHHYGDDLFRLVLVVDRLAEGLLVVVLDRVVLAIVLLIHKVVSVPKQIDQLLCLLVELSQLLLTEFVPVGVGLALSWLVDLWSRLVGRELDVSLCSGVVESLDVEHEFHELGEGALWVRDQVLVADDVDRQLRLEPKVVELFPDS